jgi:tetratricopeptide (TPR) repeat protein
MAKPAKSQLKKTLMAAGALILLTLVVYLPVIHCGYVWDDDFYVTANPLLTDTDGLKRIWFSLDSPSQYFPLVYTAFRMEYAMWGLNPLGYHLVNVFIHAMNALLVWLVLSRLRIRGAWLAAAIFALHPVNVESVAWITERKNTLSTLFYLLAMLAWLRFADKGTTRAWRYYSLALFFYALALSAKTTVCTLPIALLIVLWIRGEPVNRRRVAQVIPFLAMAVAMGLITVWWEHGHQGTQGAQWALHPIQRLLIASHAIWFYLGKLVWPAQLTFSYPKWHISTADPRQYVWVAGLISLAAAIYGFRKIGKGPAAAAIFFAATLIPMLGFFSLYTFRYSYVADHYQYVACLGPIALFSWAVSGRWKSPKVNYAIGLVLPGLILCTLGILTWRQTHIYRDPVTIWADTLAKNPKSILAHDSVGVMLAHQGRYEEALEHYKIALSVGPDAETYDAMGVSLFALGRRNQAIDCYRTAIALNNRNPYPHLNLAAAMYFMGDYAEAWKEVHLGERYGGTPIPDFIEALSQQMPDPGSP